MPIPSESPIGTGLPVTVNDRPVLSALRLGVMSADVSANHLGRKNEGTYCIPVFMPMFISSR